MTCVFCERNRKLTREHVWPQWVRSSLDHPAGPGTATRTVIRAGGREEWSYRARPANVVVRSVCEECNGGWMSELEQRAMPVLLPMIEDRGPVTLEASDADTVATWALKTSLAAGSEFKPPIPKEFYTEFYETREPVGKVRVWIGRTPHLETHTIDFRPMTVRREGEDPPADPNGYQAVLSVGHLALYVVGWRGPKPQLDRVFSWFGETALVKVLPYEPPVIWPPPATLTLITGLDALANRLAEITDPATGSVHAVRGEVPPPPKSG